MFRYIDVSKKLKGCEGWINLFYNDEILALVRDVDLANKIKYTINNSNRSSESLVDEIMDELNVSSTEFSKIYDAVEYTIERIIR